MRLAILPVNMRFTVICILLFHYLADARKRIISGREADISEFPYQISLELDGKHTCGGTILSEWYIVTAGHCVHAVDIDPYKLPELKARVGASVSNMNEGDVYNVRRVMKHAQYMDNPVTNDIALVRLDRPIVFSNRVKPIRIAEIPPNVGDKAWVTGYGLTNIQVVPPPDERQPQPDIYEDKAEPRDLRVVRLPIVSIDRCQHQLSLRGAVVTPGMICAGYSRGNRDACKGDSGGPLVIGDRLVGITAWGIGCGEEGLPGVYTSVAEYADFIKTAVDQMNNDYDAAAAIPNERIYPFYYPLFYQRA